MSKSTVFIVVAMLANMVVIPAQADTTIYTTSELSGGNAVANPGNSLGLPDSSVATLSGFSWIAYQTDAFFNAFDITVELTGVTTSTTLAVFAGQTNGAGGFINLAFVFFEAVNGSNNIVSAGLSSHCASIGGCDTFIVFNFETGTLSLDSADTTLGLAALSAVAANPEPGTWAFMLLGFAMLAWQLKRLKKGGVTSGRPQNLPHSAFA